MDNYTKLTGFDYFNMPNIPQSGMFHYRGTANGVDQPLQIEMLEFGKNSIGKAWEQHLPAQPFNRIFHLTAGARGEVVLDRRRIPLRSGRMYLIPLETPFRMRWFPSGAFGYVHFTAKDSSGLDVFRETRQVLDRPLPPWMKTLAPLIHHPLTQPGDALALPVAYLAAIVAFVRMADVEALWLRAAAAQPLQQVLTLIQERNSARLRVHELAVVAGMSSAALSQAFRRGFGHSLKSHLTQDLLQRVIRELTNTNKTVRQIAQELGFSRATHLAATFRRVFGLPPLKYRAVMHPRGASRQLYGHPYRDRRPWADHLRHTIPPRTGLAAAETRERRVAATGIDVVRGCSPSPYFSAVSGLVPPVGGW